MCTAPGAAAPCRRPLFDTRRVVTQGVGSQEGAGEWGSGARRRAASGRERPAGGACRGRGRAGRSRAPGFITSAARMLRPHIQLRGGRVKSPACVTAHAQEAAARLEARAPRACWKAHAARAARRGRQARPGGRHKRSAHHARGRPRPAAGRSPVVRQHAMGAGTPACVAVARALPGPKLPRQPSHCILQAQSCRRPGRACTARPCWRCGPSWRAWS